MKIRPRLLWLTLSIIILVFAGSLFLDRKQATIASDQPTTDISLGVDQSQEVVVRFYYDSQEQLNAVAGQLDIWEVHQVPGIGPSSGYAIAAVYPAQQEWLQVQGYRVELDLEKTAELQAPAAVLDPQYYYFDNYVTNPNGLYIVNFLQSTTASYPGLTELLDIGNAWSGGHGGHARDMWVLRISNEDPQYGLISDKPPFFLMANIHAREVTTPEMAIRYIKYLTTGYQYLGGYGVDPDVTWLVNHHVVYVLVSQNPDGHAINEADWTSYWRKNVDNAGCADPYSWGVDLNRNSSFKWGCCGGSSGEPCDEVYRGPSRASEPETAALQAYITTVFEDWNGGNDDNTLPPAAPDDTVGIFFSLHSYQDEILWAYECAPTCGQPPNGAQLQTIGNKLADLTTRMLPAHFLYTVDGGTIDYVYGKLGIPAYTFEIGPVSGTCGNFFPSYDCQDGINGAPRNFWGEMKPALLYANKIAGSPYITAYGPDTLNLSATPQENPTLFDLAGNVIDQRYPGDPLQPIIAAEYFIDAPGTDGAGFAMSPSDGNWGGTSENVEAVVDASGLSQGRHYLLVHGKNDDNFWGPYTAVFIDVSTPTYGLALTPDTAELQADPGQTVTYHMQILNIGLNSDTYDLSLADQWPYSMPSTIGPLSSGESAAFDVAITIPEGAINGESDIATLMAVSEANGNVNDSSVLTTAANYYDLTLTPATAEANGYPGGQVDYVLQITNIGNAADIFDISTLGDWPVTAPATIGPVERGQWVDVNISVSVPLTAMPGDFDVSTITATSQGDGSKVQTSSLTTTAVQAGPIVNPATDEGSGNPGTSVIYTLQLTNHNFVADTFTLAASSGWVIDYPETVGPIPADGSTEIQITVQVPADADGGASDTAVLTITSSVPDLPSATATLITSANNIYSFTAVPLENPLTAHGTGISVQYTLLVTNNGNVTDSFEFHLITSDWLVDVPADTDPIARGESASVIVTIHVPLDIVMGASNDATLAVISQGGSFGHQVHLHTDTFWYSFFLPVTQKH